MTLTQYGSLLCGNEQPHFFIFDFSTAHPLLFYSYIPIVFISLLIGFYIFLKDKGSIQSKVLLTTTLTFILWVINILVQWVASPHSALMFSWQLTAIFEVALFLSVIYLSYVLLFKRNLPFAWQLILALPIIITIGLTPTTVNIAAYDPINCEGITGTLWTVIYILEPVAIALIVLFGIKRYRSTSDSDIKKQAIIFTLGASLFLFIFFASNFYGEITRVYEFNLWGPVGMAIFLASIAYSIVRFKAFNIKLIGAQALMMAIILLIGAEFFFVNNFASRLVVTITFALISIVGFLLVKSVKREVEQREYLEKISKELSAANDQLRVLDKQKNEFLSFASHDLKSPIALIKQFASLIYDGTYKDPAKVHGTVLKIKNTADRAVNMVNTFLDLRKIEEGRMEYNFENKNIVEFVGSITADFTLLAKQQKNITVSFNTPQPDIQVKIDTNTLRQVIQNFLDNSFKYTEAGWIKVDIISEQKTVLIKVSDSGLGMSKELLPILFGQFHRDPGTAKKIQGTGLGLYIAKQIVIAHHGDTWAESEGPGKGSQFYIRLPKA